MEDWLDSGKLSQEEFVQLVRLTARYLYWDVDQFDHWEMPTPENGPMFVDFTLSAVSGGVDPQRIPGCSSGTATSAR